MRLQIILSLVIFNFFTSQPGQAKNNCKLAGPQAPRDISIKNGINPSNFSFAPSPKNMNLCNIHFHKNAEHKGPGFSINKGKGEHGGYACNESKSVGHQKSESGPKACHNVEVGDTVEVHWVFSTCKAKPGKGLESCLTQECINPELRVEAGIFLVTNDPKANDFMDYGYKKSRRQTYYQPKQLPSGSASVEFLGSSTGPSYSNTNCSPFQVTWNVRPECKPLSIKSLDKWCQKNPFSEDHAHGVRELVTDPNLLSKIK